MSHHIKRKVKPNKTEYLIIIKENQIYDISININNSRTYIISLSHIEALTSSSFFQVQYGRRKLSL